MIKENNLVICMIIIYVIILAICGYIYYLFKLFNVDISLASNLLIWSATIYAPIVLLITYRSWNEQKGSEVVAEISRNLIVSLDEYKTQIDKIFGNILNNQLRDSDNVILQRFLKPKMNANELKNLWYSLEMLRNNINKNLKFIGFKADNQEIKKMIDKYDEFNRKIHLHITVKSQEEVIDQFFIIEFSQLLEELIVELYEYALYRKTLKF